jgi:hypothetical protein
VNVNAPDSYQVIGLILHSLRMQFLGDLHQVTGHLGETRLEAVLRQRAYWLDGQPMYCGRFGGVLIVLVTLVQPPPKGCQCDL